MLLKGGMVKKVWADFTMRNMRKAPEFGGAISKDRSYWIWVQGEKKETEEEKKSEFGMEVERWVSRNGNGSERNVYCRNLSLWAGGGTLKSSQLQRVQTNNTDENILLRKMVDVMMSRDKFAREGLEMVVMPSLARAAEMACGTDTKGLKPSSWSRQGWRFTKKGLSPRRVWMESVVLATRFFSFSLEMTVVGRSSGAEMGRWARSVSCPERRSTKPLVFWNETWLLEWWEQLPKVGKGTGELLQGFKEDNPGVPHHEQARRGPSDGQGHCGVFCLSIGLVAPRCLPLTQEISQDCDGSPLSACIKTVSWWLFGEH